MDKPLTDFPLAASGAQGRGSYCKACMLERSKVSYRKRMAAQGKTVREKEVLPEGHKRCRDCKAIKPLEEFRNNKNVKNGKVPYCKPCHNSRGRESRIRLHGNTRSYHLKARYGIDAAAAEKLLQAQGGLCALCRERPAEHVDHDHTFGHVRGILCFNCNGGLGQFRDRVDIMAKAIDYLERTTWQRTQVCTGVYRLCSPRRAPVASATS